MKPSLLKFDESQEYFFEEGCFILELSNSENDPGLSIARARVAPGVRTRLHLLESAAERYVILSGQGQVEIGNEINDMVVAGDVVVIPPGTLQRVRNTGSEDLVFLALCTPRFRPEDYRDVEGNE